MPEFKRKPLEGIFCLTPLALKEDQEINYAAIRSNIEWLEEKGIPGFIQLGCMGQMNAVSEEEFNKVCDVCVDTARGKKIAAVVSSTATSTREVVRRIKYAEDAGADGSMLPIPYAFPLKEEWAVEFYQTVDKSIKGEIAIMVYNYPPLTRFNITAAMWRNHLLDIKSIKAVKDSNPAVIHRDEMVMTIGDKVNFFSSSDEPFWHDAMLGGKGMIGELAWCAPRVMLKYYQECQKGNQKDPWVMGVFRTIVKTWGTIRSAEMPALDSYEHGYLNAMVEIGGAIAGAPRKPYEPLPREARQKLEECVRPLMEMEKNFE